MSPEVNYWLFHKLCGKGFVCFTFFLSTVFTYFSSIPYPIDFVHELCMRHFGHQTTLIKLGIDLDPIAKLYAEEWLHHDVIMCRVMGLFCSIADRRNVWSGSKLAYAGRDVIDENWGDLILLFFYEFLIIFFHFETSLAYLKQNGLDSKLFLLWLE